MSKALKALLIALLALFLVPVTVFGDDGVKKDDAPEAAEAAAENANENGDEAMKKALETGEGEENAKAAKSEASTDSGSGDAAPEAKADDTSEKDKRDAALYDRLKRFVKRVDKVASKGAIFPAPNVERALRQEFVRRADGKMDIAWRGKKRVGKVEAHIALDNLELLVTYAEKLLDLSAKNSRAKGKALEDMKLMAVKLVIDHFNRPKNREMSTITENPHGISAFGREERHRRLFLVAGQVGGEDYTAIPGRNFEDFTNNYRKALVHAMKTYDKFAQLLGGGRNIASVDSAPAPSEKGAKKGKGKNKPEKGSKGKNAKKPKSKKKSKKKSSDDE